MLRESMDSITTWELTMTSKQFLHVKVPSFLQVGCSGLQFVQTNVGVVMVVLSLGVEGV